MGMSGAVPLPVIAVVDTASSATDATTSAATPSAVVVVIPRASGASTVFRLDGFVFHCNWASARELCPIPNLLLAKRRAPNHLATWPCSYFSV